MPPYYPRNNPERMARKTSADGVHGQMEEEKKQEDHQTTPEKALEKERDLNTLGSESTDGIDSPWADAGGHPTPEDESRPTNESEKSQEFESEHLVTCIFTVSLAVPLNLPRTKSWISSRQDVPRTASKMREGLIPKMHRFYHMEYFLLPDDTEPRKLDLVLFGPTAKLFLDSESKSGTPKENERPRSKKQSTLHTSVVKPWLENDQIWVSWNHSIEINVTNDFLVKLRDHKIKLRLWDNKEKMCAKAKFCKPKASHLDQPDVDSWVKHMVLFQREHLQRTQPKPSYTKRRTEQVSTVQEKSAVSAPAGFISATSKYQEEESNTVEVPTSAVRIAASPRDSKSEELNSPSFISISGSIPSSLQERTLREAKHIKQKYSAAKIPNPTSSTKSDLGKSTEQGYKRDRSNSLFLQLSEKKKSRRKSISAALEKRQRPRKTPAKEAGAQAHFRKYGIAFIHLDLMPLLSGKRGHKKGRRGRKH